MMHVKKNQSLRTNLEVIKIMDLVHKTIKLNKTTLHMLKKLKNMVNMFRKGRQIFKKIKFELLEVKKVVSKIENTLDGSTAG